MADKGRDPETGRFAAGNRFWEARSTHGRNPIFDSPDQLWGACVEYFEWVEDNPLHEAKAFAHQGNVTVANLPKMRAMTLAGLCLFLGISRDTWNEWRSSRPDLSEVQREAEEIIYSQKFSGAAADLLNANIIARDLGLADRSQIGNPPGETFKTEVSARDLIASRIAGIATRAGSTEGDSGSE